MEVICQYIPLVLASGAGPIYSNEVVVPSIWKGTKMSFEVMVQDGQVKVRLPKQLRGTEYLRLDMSDGSVAFLSVVRPRRGNPIFKVNKELLSPALWAQLELHLNQLIAEIADRISSIQDVTLSRIDDMRTSQVTIGKALQVTCDMTLNQAGVAIPHKRRASSEPIRIVRASATNYKRKAVEREVRQHKAPPA